MGCDDKLVTLSFCSRASRLKLLRSVVRDAACMAGLDQEASDAVVLAVNEACMNIIQHGYAANPDGRIDVTILLQDQALVFQLRDFAEPVNVEKVCARDLDELRPGGLGMHLIECLMDEYGFLEPPEGGGNLFQMKKHSGR